MLATGGARGITAELVRDLARPGVRLVLVGRSSGVNAGEDLEAETDGDAAALRRILAERTLARGDAAQATPARIEARIQENAAASLNVPPGWRNSGGSAPTSSITPWT